MREKWGRFKGELLWFSPLETLAEPGRVHGHTGQNHENGTNRNGFCVLYAGYLHKKVDSSKTSRLLDTSKTGIFYKGEVQRVTPTFSVQESMMNTMFVYSSNISFMWGIVGKWVNENWECE